MKSSVQVPVVKITGETQISSPDLLAIEEPLEIRLAYTSGDSTRIHNLAVTMRTPGNDAELATGFIFTEGIIPGIASIRTAAHVFIACAEDKQNVIQVELASDAVPNLSQSDRNFYTTSSCGVCGKASISAIRTVSTSTKSSKWTSEAISSALIFSLPQILFKRQAVFAETGGLHAAALFDTTGELLLVREDVGRHNAVDKLIGAVLLQGTIQLNNTILLLSGRASFELVQKAAMAGIPVIAAVGAPSSLAVSLAEEFGITLLGFLRNQRFNIYSAAHRIKMAVHENTY